MKAKQGVVDFLNSILTNELTAINQYVVQSAMLNNWGYQRLGYKFRELSIEEMKDAQELIDHILYLESVPNMQRLGTVHVGENPREQIALALQVEQSAVKTLAEAITHCNQVADYTTRNMLEEMVRDEEGHVDWLETQLATIEQIGLPHYLSQQLKKE